MPHSPGLAALSEPQSFHLSVGAAGPIQREMGEGEALQVIERERGRGVRVWFRIPPLAPRSGKCLLSRFFPLLELSWSVSDSDNYNQ